MNENQKKEFYEKDLYKFFDLDETSTIEQIKKAYRKLALVLHPDKNLDNKEEAEKKFIELGKAFEILSDDKAKAAYDAVLRNKKQRQEKLNKLDERSKKFKQDLEARENLAKSSTIKKTAGNDEEQLKREIERLRREGSKILEAEMNRINEEISLKSKVAAKMAATETYRLKIKWKSTTDEHKFTDVELLKYLFGKYGDIECVLLNSKKTGALIEFKTINGARSCWNDRNNLNEKYLITIECIGDNLLFKEENDVIIINEDENNLSLEELEAQILKKLLNPISNV
jgi:DnaJ family protein C protein 17